MNVEVIFQRFDSKVDCFNFASNLRLLLKFYLYIFIVISLNYALSLFAQEPYYYTINDENGLPSNEVYQVLQDDFGYIWIGCDA